MSTLNIIPSQYNRTSINCQSRDLSIDGKSNRRLKEKGKVVNKNTHFLISYVYIFQIKTYVCLKMYILYCVQSSIWSTSQYDSFTVVRIKTINCTFSLMISLHSLFRNATQ